MRKHITAILATTLATGLALTPLAYAEDIAVKISADLPSVDIVHEGQKTTIMRNQDQEATIDPKFAKTSRKCPPFCIQPAKLAPGVETIAELEVLDYLQKMSAGDDSILVVDSRTPDWVARGTIPGSVNIPWTSLSLAHSDPLTVGEILQDKFNCSVQDEIWDFSAAKTLVMFCNGMWCGQSPNNIKTLLKLGYPAHKLKWYRGGMQTWSTLGLTTVKPSS